MGAWIPSALLGLAFVNLPGQLVGPLGELAGGIDLSANPMVGRELALIKVKSEPTARPEIMGLVETFRAAVVDIGTHSLMVQVVGDTEKIDAMIELLAPYGIRELSRTGVTAMIRGNA